MEAAYQATSVTEARSNGGFNHLGRSGGDEK